jgi:hypothetical protein
VINNLLPNTKDWHWIIDTICIASE